MENPLYTKSKQLALSIVEMHKRLTAIGEYTMSKQVLKSGTSIGANIREAKRPQSEADCVSKLSIALKEAEETAFWLEILSESGYITSDIFQPTYSLTEEIIKILVTVIRNKNKIFKIHSLKFDFQ